MNHTTLLIDSAQLRALHTAAPFYYTPEPSLFSGIPDTHLSLALPVLAYWVASLFFHALDTSGWAWLDPYRIHESTEVTKRNRVTRSQVLRAVILQQVVQTVVGWWWVDERPAGAAVDHVGAMVQMAPTVVDTMRTVLGDTTGAEVFKTYGADVLYALYWWALPVVRFFIAMFIIDTWQYVLHRLMHTIPFLYRHLHSVHHRLYVPYAFGALYNHPLEGFLLDTLGAVIAEAAVGMSTREAGLLFAVSTLKTVDDHCGYRLPLDPFQLFGGNTADYHDIHHQTIGIKSNFSQPFFVHWDVLLGTRMTRQDIERRRAQRKAQ